MSYFINVTYHDVIFSISRVDLNDTIKINLLKMLKNKTGY